MRKKATDHRRARIAFQRTKACTLWHPIILNPPCSSFSAAGSLAARWRPPPQLKANSVPEYVFLFVRNAHSSFRGPLPCISLHSWRSSGLVQLIPLTIATFKFACGWTWSHGPVLSIALPWYTALTNSFYFCTYCCPLPHSSVGQPPDLTTNTHIPPPSTTHLRPFTTLSAQEQNKNYSLQVVSLTSICFPPMHDCWGRSGSKHGMADDCIVSSATFQCILVVLKKRSLTRSIADVSELIIKEPTSLLVISSKSCSLCLLL